MTLDTTEPKTHSIKWWEWVNKPSDSLLMIHSEIYDPVMMLTEEERNDRAVVNETMRTARSPLRPASSADQYRVPIATE